MSMMLTYELVYFQHCATIIPILLLLLLPLLLLLLLFLYYLKLSYSYTESCSYKMFQKLFDTMHGFPLSIFAQLFPVFLSLSMLSAIFKCISDFIFIFSLNQIKKILLWLYHFLFGSLSSLCIFASHSVFHSCRDSIFMEKTEVKYMRHCKIVCRLLINRYMKDWLSVLFTLYM